MAGNITHLLALSTTSGKLMAQSCREPDSFADALGSVSKFGVVRIAHITGVRSETAPLPHHRAGTVAPLTDDHRGEVRMPRCSRRQRSPQGGMSPIWETPFTGCAHGANPCPSVSRGGRHSEVQHQTVGHESQRPRHRRTGDQGLASGCRALQIQPDLFRTLTLDRMRLATQIGTDSASGNGLRDVTQEVEACCAPTGTPSYRPTHVELQEPHADPQRPNTSSKTSRCILLHLRPGLQPWLRLVVLERHGVAISYRRPWNKVRTHFGPRVRTQPRTFLNFVKSSKKPCAASSTAPGECEDEAVETGPRGNGKWNVNVHCST